MKLLLNTLFLKIGSKIDSSWKKVAIPTMSDSVLTQLLRSFGDTLFLVAPKNATKKELSHPTEVWGTSTEGRFLSPYPYTEMYPIADEDFEALKNTMLTKVESTLPQFDFHTTAKSKDKINYLNFFKK